MYLLKRYKRYKEHQQHIEGRSKNFNKEKII